MDTMRPYANLPTYRSYKLPNSEADPAKTEYHGMVKWLLKNKQIQLIQDLNGSRGDESKVTTFVWEEKDTQAARDELFPTLWNFMQSYGGPHGRDQWVKCLEYHQQIALAANSLWGYPHRKGAPRELRDLQEPEFPADRRLWAETLGTKENTDVTALDYRTP
jgi:hypothetical protein